MTALPFSMLKGFKNTKVEYLFVEAHHTLFERSFTCPDTLCDCRMKHDRIKTILLTLIIVEATGHMAKILYKKINQIMEELWDSDFVSASIGLFI